MTQKNKHIYKLLFNPMVYDILQTITLSYRFRKKIILKTLGNKKGKFLDIGCATANVLEYINNNVDYYGFDTNQNYINHAKKKYKNQNFFCEYFSSDNFSKLPNFDFVLLSAVVHHLSNSEVSNLLDLINLKLNKDAKLLIMDPFISSEKYSLRNFFGKIDRGRFVRSFDEYIEIFSSKVKIIDIYKTYPLLPPHNWVVSVLKKK